MKKIILLLSAILLLVGCGSDDVEKKNIDANRTEESNVTTPPKNTSVDYTIPLKYEYNKDGSATQELAPLYVNKYKDVQKTLDTLVDDKEKFENQYEWYVGDLISTQRAIDKHPSYAPRGDDKSLIVTVKDGQIDYSSYQLKGDIDENGEVDFEDEQLLKEALLGSDDKYDINGDGIVDIKDTIDLLARLGTEIKTFDFYTIDGAKLDIASREFSDARSFSYGGTENTIMVVAKDANGVSGFTSGLSDIGTLWYVGISTQKQQRLMQKEEGLEATNPDRIKFVKEALKAIEQEPNPYLLGWQIVIKFTTLDNAYLELDANGILDMDTFFFQPMEDKIDSHFEINMGETKLPRTLQKDKYFFKRGINLDGVTVQVKAYRGVVKQKYKVNGEPIISKSTAYANSVIFSSKPNKTLSGFIKEDGELIKDKGKIKAHRIGPTPKEEDYKDGLEHAEYKLENIPFGAYKLEYERACGCTETIDNEFIFSKNRAYVDEDFNIDKKEVKVKLTVRDKEQNLLKGENVKIKSGECLDEKKIFLDTSDNAGKVSFDEVPIGKYKVYVDDVESGTIDFCKEFDGEAMGEQLWDIDAKYEEQTNPDLKKQRHSIEEWHWKKVKIADINDPASRYQELMNWDSDKGFLPHPWDENGILLWLTDTSEYSKSTSYPDGNNPDYNFDIVYEYEDNSYCIKPNSTDTLLMAHLCGTSDGTGYMNLGFGSSEVQSLLDYKKFVFIRNAEWRTRRGTSKYTFTFTPAK